MMFDKIERIGKSLVQHGPNNDRVYLMKLYHKDIPSILGQLHDLVVAKRYTKIFAKIPDWALDDFLEEDYKIEASIPGLYSGESRGYFLAKFYGAKRSFIPRKEQKLIESVKEMAQKAGNLEPFLLPEKYHIRPLTTEDIPALARLYKSIFPRYPFPITKKVYLEETMKSDVKYYGVFHRKKLVAASSAELDMSVFNAEMTDFATDQSHLGCNLSYFLLQYMDADMAKIGLKTLYTIARAGSHGMNKTFGRLHYRFGGTLINNTLIGESIESMNIWYKNLKSN